MEMDCPRCSIGKLQEIEVDEVFIDRCRICGGLWFDQGELAQIVGGEEPVREMEEKVPEQEGDISCPKCRKFRLRPLCICHFDGGDVNIFRCPSCLGSWLDRGALRKSEDVAIAKNMKHCFNEMLT